MTGFYQRHRCHYIRFKICKLEIEAAVHVFSEEKVCEDSWIALDTSYRLQWGPFVLSKQESSSMETEVNKFTVGKTAKLRQIEVISFG